MLRCGKLFLNLSLPSFTTSDSGNTVPRSHALKAGEWYFPGFAAANEILRMWRELGVRWVCADGLPSCSSSVSLRRSCPDGCCSQNTGKSEPSTLVPSPARSSPEQPNPGWPPDTGARNVSFHSMPQGIDIVAEQNGMIPHLSGSFRKFQFLSVPRKLLLVPPFTPKLYEHHNNNRYLAS